MLLDGSSERDAKTLVVMNLIGSNSEGNCMKRKLVSLLEGDVKGYDRKLESEAMIHIYS